MKIDAAQIGWIGHLGAHHRAVPEPAVAALSPRGQAWEMKRYRAYQAQLAGHHRGNLWAAAAFLTLTAANATSITDISARRILKASRRR